MCSILCWILFIWEAFRRFSGGFEPFLGSPHRSNRPRSLVEPVRVLVLFTCCTPVWPVVLTGLTDQGWVAAAALFQVVFCMHSSRGCICSRGACMCAGGALCVAWALFCLGCVEPLPLPKGSETCLLQVILLFAFVWLSIACWSFFLLISFFLFSLVTLCGYCQCTHQGEIEDHAWFEDRWMVVSLCH
jgi:hypothetical protein